VLIAEAAKKDCMALILMYNDIKIKPQNAASMKSLTITLKLPLLPGSISTARSTCGKPQCPCHSDPACRHGLYYRWTGIIDGKRTTRTISRAQAQQCRARIKNYRLLQNVIARLLRQALLDAPWNQ
jgi:hypothetical protein